MKEKLKQIRTAALEQLDAADSTEKLEQLRVKFLGKKGELTAVLRGMGALSPEERPAVGQIANEIREAVEKMIADKKEKLSAELLQRRLESEKIDVTMPAKRFNLGHRHPLAQVEDEMCSIFRSMGFDIEDGPEVETDYYNFQALNTPENHPARDAQDTFYITDNILLRSQTSSVQVHAMERAGKPPIRVVSPGRVYRSDAVDATHSPMFHQLEGLVVDKDITMGDLKGTLETFARRMFGNDTKIRFRPHHFPFTEPSAEIDISCFMCGGKGCKVCKGEGWIEILGAGNGSSKRSALFRNRSRCIFRFCVWNGYRENCNEEIFNRRYALAI